MPIILNGTTGITTPGITNTGPFTFQGVVELPAGAVGAPSLTTTGDTNTGIYFPAADQVAISTGGTQRLVADASGNVGIGTASPVERLQVSGGGLKVTGTSTVASGSGAGLYLNYVSGSNYGEVLALDQGVAWKTLRLNAADIQFYIAGGEQMRLNSSGNLGIGATASLTGSSRRALTLNSAAGQLSIVEFGINGTIGGYVYANASQLTLSANGASNTSPMTFETGAAERMRLDSSGNLGLGVTPSAWSTAGKNMQFGNGPASIGTQNSGDANFMHNAYESPAGTFKYVSSGIGSVRYQLDINNNAHKWYYAASGTAGNNISFTQAMTLDASGQLGVGTTTPDIFGRFYTRSIGFSSSGSTVLQINGSSYGGIDIGAAGTRTFGLTAGGTEANLTTLTNIPLLFGTNATERARISSGGDFGINTSSPGNKLQVVAASATLSADVINIDGGSTGFSGANDAGTSYSLIFNACAYSIASGVVQRTGAAISMAKEYSWNQAVAVQGTKGALVFKTNSGDIATPALTERARITSNGQIITAYDGGRYTKRGIVPLGSAFDNPVQSIITLPASGSTNTVISIKVTCNQNAYATAAANQHIGNARAMWDGSAWVKEVDTMTVVCGDIATVGTLAWSGSTLQYTTNRVSNYDNYLVTYEVLNNPTVTTLTYAF